MSFLYKVFNQNYENSLSKGINVRIDFKAYGLADALSLANLVTRGNILCPLKEGRTSPPLNSVKPRAVGVYEFKI